MFNIYSPKKGHIATLFDFEIWSFFSQFGNITWFRSQPAPGGGGTFWMIAS